MSAHPSVREPLAAFVPGAGVLEATGAYLRPATSVEQLAATVLAQPFDGERADELGDRVERLSGQHLGAKSGVDVCDLASAGWGVVFGPDVSPAVREALAPLLAHRRAQASARHEERYRELEYHAGEDAWTFLDRHDCDFGPVDPEKLPYYLLLVGGPASIPFEFQYELDLEPAVGRLAFDTPEEYAAYAAAVVAAET